MNRRVASFVVLAGIAWLGGGGLSPEAVGQIAGGLGGGGVGGGGMGGGQGGQMGQGGQQGGQTGVGQVGGILVDPQGVVRPAMSKDHGGALERKRREELAGRSLPADLNSASPLRKVSLAGLESACAVYARDKQHVTGEMQYLAGLQQIDYVFVYPEEHDIVIAGPAEGYVVDAAGRALGAGTGRPPLRLDDLMVALRALEHGGGALGCSIDPRDENMAKLKSYLSEPTGATTRAQAQARFAKLPQILGMQDVRIFGVPAESHFAEVFVEADLRMKRQSIGVDPPLVKGFKSHLTYVGPGENSVQRWWFAPLYDALTRSADGLAFQFAGQRVQLMSQEELVTDAGKRSSAPFTHVSAQKFSKQFTDRYSDIAAAVPVFAELQNLFDLAVLAALLKRERLPEKAGWRRELFLDPKRATIVKRSVPRQVESLGNHKMLQGRLYVAQVGGGVTIDPWQMLLHGEYRRDSGDELRTARERGQVEQPDPRHSWWWD